jgi:hypothetical protein
LSMFMWLSVNTAWLFSISIQKDANNHAEVLLQKGAMCMYLI